MEIEKIPKQIWIDIITEKINCDYESLALKILLGRLKIDIKHNSSAEAFQRYADELKSFFIRTQKMPSSQKDLQEIISKGGI